MGIANFTIPKNDITFSSSYLRKVNPGYARLNNGDSAWCTSDVIDSSIQIDLGGEWIVSGVESQGSPSSNSWVTRFEVLHSMNSDDDWSVITSDYNNNNNKV